MNRRRKRSGISAVLFGGAYSSPVASELPLLSERFSLAGPTYRTYYVRMATGNLYLVVAPSPVEAARIARVRWPLEGEPTVTGGV